MKLADPTEGSDNLLITDHLPIDDQYILWYQKEVEDIFGNTDAVALTKALMSIVEAEDAWNPVTPTLVSFLRYNSTAASTGLGDNLEKFWLIMRVMSTEDRRKIHLLLTDKWREYLQLLNEYRSEKLTQAGISIKHITGLVRQITEELVRWEQTPLQIARRRYREDLEKKKAEREPKVVS